MDSGQVCCLGDSIKILIVFVIDLFKKINEREKRAKAMIDGHLTFENSVSAAFN